LCQRGSNGKATVWALCLTEEPVPTRQRAFVQVEEELLVRGRPDAAAALERRPRRGKQRLQVGPFSQLSLAEMAERGHEAGEQAPCRARWHTEVTGNQRESKR